MLTYRGVRRDASHFVLMAAVLLAAGLASRLAASQAPTAPALPAASAVIARHVAAIGGEAAYRAVQSVRARGRVQIVAQGISGDVDLLSARPNKLINRVTIPGIGVIESGFDGRTGWSTNPVAGPELLTGRQLSEAADDAWFDSALHLSDHVRTMTTLARETFDGHAAFKLRVVYKSGNEQFEYFDAESGLQIGSESTKASPQGLIPTVNLMRDYRRFGGLLQPTTIIQRALGLEQMVTITSCEYNNVPAAAFEPPASVKALQPR
jgi:hypothetical protein